MTPRRFHERPTEDEARTRLADSLEAASAELGDAVIELGTALDAIGWLDDDIRAKREASVASLLYDARNLCTRAELLYKDLTKPAPRAEDYLP